MRGWLAAASVLALVACGSGDIGSAPKAEPPAEEPTPEDFDISDLSAEDTLAYLEKLAPPLIGRVLDEAERVQIADEGGAAIVPILQAWGSEPGLVMSARSLMEEKLSVSGASVEIDYSLPGNLVAFVVENDRPWAEILTSESCYDGEGNVIACDSGAPFTAGVLTTRGYLASRASRFNLTRSSTLMRAFACQVYPQEESLQPKIAPERLMHLFAITDLAQATEEEKGAAVNTGCACHDCHGQFAAHSQLFVKFDQTGVYQADADGIQDPEGELGRSVNGLMASHFEDPVEAASEASQIFGTPVANLAEAAATLSEHPVFVQCAAQNILEYTLRIDTAGPLGKTVDADLLERIADSTEAPGHKPTYAEIVEATFSDPGVVFTVVQGLTGDEQ
ncbi:MAG: hypothetical protein JNK04_25420 [Myxococcales bacterium]|nr:hypothetical protein [Myxococcales bacterium]